ncbi:MAG: PAS domain S-box protein, partial [Gammaproteobacteria bacterium]|nr:PAS domain S-box protein [Gammaproteobacteria bacterium]
MPTKKTVTETAINVSLFFLKNITYLWFPKKPTFVRKVTILLVTSICLLLLLMNTINYIEQVQTLNTLSEERVISHSKIFWNHLDEDAIAMEGVLHTLAINTSIVTSLKQGNRKALLQQTTPLYKKLKSRFNLNHFYFIDTQGRVILRAHDPGTFGDQINRTTFLQAKTTGEMATGIEAGPNRYSQRIVLPVKENNQVIGYFELGEDLAHHISELKALTNSNVSLWVSSNNLKNQIHPEEIHEFNGWHNIVPPDSSNHNVIMEQVSTQISTTIDKVLHVSVDGEDHVVGLFPFKGVHGKNTSIALIYMDLNREKIMLNNQILTSILIASVMLLISIFLAHRFARELTLPMRRAAKEVEDISNGNFTNRLSISSTDEVGDICRATNHLLDTLENASKITEEILETAVDGIITINDQGILETFNPAAEKIFGYSASEVIGNNVSMLMPNHHADQHDKYLHRNKMSHHSQVTGFSREVQGKRKDGSIFPMDIALSEMTLNNRRLFNGIVRDISELKYIEQDLMKFGRILDHSWNEIYIFDATSFKFTQVSYGAVLNTGYSKEELYNLTAYDIKPEFSKEQLREMLTRLVFGIAKQLTFKTLHQRKNGSTYPVEIRLQMIEDQINPMYLAIVQDITERVRAEEQIMELARFPEETSNPVLKIAGNGIVTYANAASEPVRKYWGVEVGKETPRSVFQLVKKAINENTSQELELDCFGQFFLMLLAPVPELDSVYVYGSDITQHKKDQIIIKAHKE